MRTITTILCLLLSLVAAGPVSADETLAGAAKRYGYTQDVVARLEAVFGEAKAAGLSVDPLRIKSIEGMAKRVPADRLVDAVRNQKARMSALRGAAPEVAKSAAIERAGLTALAGGLSPATVAAITSRSKDEGQIQAGLYAAGLLKSAGIEEGSAAKFVGTQLEAGLRAAEIDELTHATARAARAGLVGSSDLANMRPADVQGERRSKFLESVRGFDTRREEGADRVRSPRAEGGDRAAEADRIRRDRLAEEKRKQAASDGPIVNPPEDKGDNDDHHDDEPEHEDDK